MAGKPVVIEPWVLAPVQAYLDLHDQWHQPDAQGHARPRYPNHPLFCWARGPGSYRSCQDNPAVTPELSPGRSPGHSKHDAHILGEGTSKDRHRCSGGSHLYINSKWSS